VKAKIIAISKDKQKCEILKIEDPELVSGQGSE
jgi:hypothetical protein